MESVTNRNISPDVVAEAVDRAGRSDFERWLHRVKVIGGCAHPVRLAGRMLEVDPATGEATSSFSSACEPDGVLLKACGSRRATSCPSCAIVYRLDARALVLAGLAGGKGMPEAIATHPAVFATLTAPSFGAVHTVAEGRPCHPSQRRCPHGRSLLCRADHTGDDDRLGSALCPDCYDYAGAVVWNALASTLWQRTGMALRRALAGIVGLPVRQLPGVLRVSFVKVIEYQRRGVVHVHAAIRLDGVGGSVPDCAPVDLEAAVRLAALRAWAPNPLEPDQPIQWGPQIEVSSVLVDERRRIAGYLAKYATKSTDEAGVLDRRLNHGDPTVLPLPDHLRRMVCTAWELADDHRLAPLNLRAWAHTLGYRGHWLTKSRSWSTTFAELRSERRTWRRRQQEGEGHDGGIEIGDWTWRGVGYATDGDAWLARSVARQRAQARRAAWEDRP